jgi:hypothetical protein
MSGNTAQQAVLMTLAHATGEAHSAARELGVQLWDAAALRDRLAELAGAPRREEAQARTEAKERAAAATKARAQMLTALGQAIAGLGVAPGTARATGHAALRAAVDEVSTLRQAAEQAFLAWDTLISDWFAAFSDRPTRTGALAIEADVRRFAEMRDRAGHLGKALKHTLEQLSRTPADGEMGYGAWRLALVEEYTARLEACRARIETIDPSRWEDIDRARSTDSQARAEQAAQAASYATARAVKAYARMAELAGIAAR